MVERNNSFNKNKPTEPDLGESRVSTQSDSGEISSVPLRVGEQKEKEILRKTLLNHIQASYTWQILLITARGENHVCDENASKKSQQHKNARLNKC